MKKLILVVLGTIALSGTHTTECFTLWPFGSEDTTQYDITELRNYLAEYKIQVHYSLKKDTIYVEYQDFGPICDRKANWIKSLPYVTKVTFLEVTTDYRPDCMPLIPWVTCHIAITLKPRAFHDLVYPEIQS